MPSTQFAPYRPKIAKRALVVLATIVALAASQPARAGEAPVSFTNDVVPILTKAGCNAGTCHAKAGNGQNGFRLSLLGFEPAEDFEHLAREARGRRLSLNAPEQSLILLKASAGVPHGGGRRLDSASPEFALLRAWIAQGAPFSRAGEPQLVSFEVRPSHGSLPRGGELQLNVAAHYSDGSERDVTALALYESNDKAMAEVSEDGLVRVHDLPGNVAVMVRFQGRVAVFGASVPLGAAVAEVPTAKTFIDELVFGNLKEIGVPPSAPCDDATFLRRVTLDVTGRLPTEEEAAAFFADKSPDRRDQVIDRLLESSDYADFFAGKWTALLKNRRDEATDIVSNFAFHAWVRDSLLANKPYDQFVRELLGATGTVIGNPPVAWYKRVKEPNEQLEDTAQLFLGVRMQCARCHHHPFERWSQDDYYSLAAFFSQIGRKPTATRGEDLIFHKRGIAQAKNVRTGEVFKPAPLGGTATPIAADQDPRLKLAEWMSGKDNPFFARSLVNRYWKHFFRRGLVEPEDDLRDTNPPTNPALLAALEKHFIGSGFDLKELVRLITRSQAYQLSDVPNEFNQADQQNYSRFYPRRLQAEVLLDAIDRLAGSQTNFDHLPPGTHAVALPDNSYNKSQPFLRAFGRPEGESACECERTESSSLAQSLHLINSAEVKAKLASPAGRAQRLAAANMSVDSKIRELYAVAFFREPRPRELETAVEYLGQARNGADGKPLDATKAAAENLQDLIWALINTKEFLFNH